MAHTRMCAIDANNERASLTGTVLKMCRCRLPIRMDMREFLVVLGRRKSVAHNTGTDKKKKKTNLDFQIASQHFNKRTPLEPIMLWRRQRREQFARRPVMQRQCVVIPGLTAADHLRFR